MLWATRHQSCAQYKEHHKLRAKLPVISVMLEDLQVEEPLILWLLV